MTETVLAPRAATPSTTAKTSTKVITDWTALIAGGFVTVLGEYKVRHSGWIDDVTEDGTIIWLVLVLALGRGRRMFFRDEGDLITVEVPHAGR